MKTIKSLLILITIICIYSCGIKSNIGTSQIKNHLFQRQEFDCDTTRYTREWILDDKTYSFISLTCFPVPANDSTYLVGWDPKSVRLTRMNREWVFPSQIGQSGKALYTNGGSVSWQDIPAQPVIASIQFYAGSTAPTGYLFCDGSAISRTTYSDLFTVIGTLYGNGDGSTTFNLPDLRQRFPLTKSVSGTGSTLAGTGGNIDHVHSVDPPNTTTGTPSATINTTAVLPGAASSTHTHDVNINAFNSASANPPYLVLNSIIKY